MKLYLGNTPVKSLNIRKLDVNTNDATIVASGMQSGMTAMTWSLGRSMSSK